MGKRIEGEKRIGATIYESYDYRSSAFKLRFRLERYAPILSYPLSEIRASKYDESLLPVHAFHGYLSIDLFA